MKKTLLKSLIIFIIITLNKNVMAALDISRGNSYTLTESYLSTSSTDQINLRLGGKLIVNPGVNITTPMIISQGSTSDVPERSSEVEGFTWFWTGGLADYIRVIQTRDFGTIDFLGSSAVSTDINGVDTILVGDGAVELNGNLKSYYTNLTKENSVIKFTKYGAVINTNIQNTSGINEVGSIIFDKDHSFNGSIGAENARLKEVQFGSPFPGNLTSFSGNIYAKRITQGRYNLAITRNTLFSASENYTAASPTYSLGLNTLTIQGNGTITGDAVFNLTANSASAGMLINDAGTLSMNATRSMLINLTDSTTTIPVGGAKAYTIFRASENNGAIILPNDNIVGFKIVSSKNPFINWTYSNGIITQNTISNVSKEIEAVAVPQIINPTDDDIANIQSIASADSSLRSDLVEAIIAGQASEFVKKLPPAIEQVADNFDTMETLVSEVSDTLNKKIGGANSLLLAEDDELKGVSAGDEKDKYGIWTNYSISSNFQKKRGRNSGYVSKNNSVVVGTDTLINEDTLIGFALGYTDSRVHHKDDNLGDRSIIKSKLVSIYSVKELDNNWYLQAQGILGEMEISNLELRGTTANREYAKSDFKVPSYGLALETGRHFQIQNNFIITPFICLEFDVTGKVKYQESGTKNQNLSVTKAIDKNLIGNTGIMITKNYHINGHSIIPEIYALIRRDLVDKPMKIQVKTNTGQPLLTHNTSNISTFYNIGASVNHLIKNTKISLGYDYYFGKKYASHQGFVGFKISF